MSARQINLLSFFPSLRQSPRFDLVMIVEDDQQDLFINSVLIRQSKSARELITESNPANVIEYLKTAIYTAIPDLILLNIELMNKDGYNLMLHFSQLPEMVRQKTKIVIVSAKYQKEERMMSLLNPYVVGYMIKPIDIYQFRDYISYQ